MSEQYFTSQPTSLHKYAKFETEILGNCVVFNTDSGVFSKDGLDFGTRTLLEAVPPLYGRILDLGCGWGAVGVSVGKKYPETQIVMSDVNERAMELAKKNLSENGVTNAEVIKSDAMDDVDGTFDFILNNPPIRAGKAVIYKMFDQASERLNPGGALYVVIRKQQGAPSAKAHLQEKFTHVEVIAKEKSYWIIECKKEADE